jgi:translation elongation factor EF-G
VSSGSLHVAYREGMRAGSVVDASAEINRSIGAKRLVACVNVELFVAEAEDALPVASNDNYKIDKGSNNHRQLSDIALGKPSGTIISLPNGCSLQLPRGTPSAFVDSFIGGVVTSLSVGPLMACALHDIRVNVGSFQVPDENAAMAPASLRVAVSQAVNNALQTARHLQDGLKSDLILLEPLMRVVVTAPQSVIGSVVSDLGNRRRGTIVELAAGDRYPSGSESESIESQVIADVPIAHLIGYASSLRSMTGGLASFSATFLKYRNVPDEDAARVLGSVLK